MENKLHSFERPRHFELEKKLWELTGKNVRFSGGYFESEKNTVYQYLIYNDLDSKKKIYFEPAEDAYVYSGDMDKYYDCLISQINVAIQEIEVEDEERRKNSKDRKVMIYGPCPPDHTHEFKKEYVGIRKSKLFNDNKDYMMFNLTCDCGMASGFDFEDIDEASNECNKHQEQIEFLSKKYGKKVVDIDDIKIGEKFIYNNRKMVKITEGYDGTPNAQDLESEFDGKCRKRHIVHFEDNIAPCIPESEWD